MIERRKARRFNIEWGVIARGNSNKLFSESGTLVNLCSHGALIHLERSPDLGTKLDLWIRLPSIDERWMKYSGEVVRVDGDSPCNIAVRFNKVRPLLTDRVSPFFKWSRSSVLKPLL